MPTTMCAPPAPTQVKHAARSLSAKMSFRFAITLSFLATTNFVAVQPVQQLAVEFLNQKTHLYSPTRLLEHVRSTRFDVKC